MGRHHAAEGTKFKIKVKKDGQECPSHTGGGRRGREQIPRSSRRWSRLRRARNDKVLVGGGAEDFADFAGEVLQGEGLLQESFFAVGGKRAGESVFGVAGKIKDLGARACWQKLLNEFVAAHAGHDDVGNDEVDGLGVSGGQGKSGVAVGGFENVVAARLERLANELANGLFVFNEENGFSSADGGERSGSGKSFGGLIDAREINSEDGAAAELALNEDVAAALLDDAVDGGEPEAGTFAFFLGGEERLEDAGLGFAVHTLAGVADGNHDVGSVLDESIFRTVGLVEGDAGGANADFAAVGHGVFSIDDEIHDDLLELTGIGASATDGGSETGGEFDIFADERAQEALHIGDDGVHVDDLEFEKLLAAEGEKLTREGSGAIGGLLNGFGLDVQRVFGSELIEENFGIAADDHEQIVEVVSDASGETADGFHFLRLTELIFEDATLGDVFGDGFENISGLVFGGDGAAADADGDGGSILALPASFKAIHATGAAEFVDQAGIFAGIEEDIFLRIEGKDFESGVVTQHSNEGRVDVEKLAFKTGTIDSVDRGLNERPVANFGAAQSLLVAFVLDGGGQLTRD